MSAYREAKAAWCGLTDEELQCALTMADISQVSIGGLFEHIVHGLRQIIATVFIECERPESVGITGRHFLTFDRESIPASVPQPDIKSDKKRD